MGTWTLEEMLETVPQPGRHRVIWTVRGKDGPRLATGAGTWGTERGRDTPDRGIKRKDRDKKQRDGDRHRERGQEIQG